MKNRMFHILVLILCVAALFSLSQGSFAQSLPSFPSEKSLSPLTQDRVAGPQIVSLAGQASLYLPEGFFFVPQSTFFQESRAPDPSTSSFVGLIVSDEIPDGFIVVKYVRSGYVHEDPEETWSRKVLLDKLRIEVAKNNTHERGVEAFAWISPPIYDAKRHHLIWSAALREWNGNRSTVRAVSYNVVALGREGYLSLELLSSVREVGRQKPMMAQLLRSIEFLPDRRYEDFDPRTDARSSESASALVSFEELTQEEHARSSFLWGGNQNMAQILFWVFLCALLCATGMLVLSWHRAYKREN